MAKCKIVLADDHVLIRQGLKKLIEENKMLEVIGEAGDGLELLDVLEHVEPDLIILDISMPQLREKKKEQIKKNQRRKSPVKQVIQ